MKKMVGLLMAVAFGCAGFAGDARETRAMWLWGSVVRDKGADFVAQDFKKHNLNCAVMLVKGMGGSASWDSKIALKKNLSKGDVLEQFGKACKKNKIDRHAWFVVNSDEAWLEKHPEDHYYHCGKDSKDNGAIYVSDCERVCTLSTGYRNYLLAMIRELAENAGKYNLKGIHLDYIRYPHAVYCFCPKHIAKGKALGVDIERLVEETEGEIIDRFLGLDDYRIVADDASDEADGAVLTEAELDDEDDLVSEELAEVYLAQGLKNEAIEIYRKLSLLNTEKSIYFARKIEDLTTNN